MTQLDEEVAWTGQSISHTDFTWFPYMSDYEHFSESLVRGQKFIFSFYIDVQNPNHFVVLTFSCVRDGDGFVFTKNRSRNGESDLDVGSCS